MGVGVRVCLFSYFTQIEGRGVVGQRGRGGQANFSQSLGE